MCKSVLSNYYSWLQSFITTVILLLSCAHTNNKNYIWIALHALTVTQIQVIESIIWGYYESKNYAKANEMTKYIVPLLWLQPLVNSIAGFVVTKNKYLLNMIYLYAFLLIYDTYYAFNGDTFSVEIGNNGHLVWKRNNKVQILSEYTGGFYLAGLIVPFLFMEDQDMKIMLIGFTVITYAILKYKYDNELNSVWCYVAGSFSTIILVSKLLL